MIKSHLSTINLKVDLNVIYKHVKTLSTATSQRVRNSEHSRIRGNKVKAEWECKRKGDGWGLSDPGEGKESHE